MEGIKGNPLVFGISTVIVICCFYFLKEFNYLLFHSLVELFSIVIAGTLFMIAWHSKKYMENKVLVFIGIGYFFVAILDLLHVLSYQGMAIFTDYDFYANQLWVAARYIESMTLLIAFAWPRKVNQMIGRFSSHGLFALYTLITGILLATIFVWKVFPVCFIEGLGQTQFKIFSEYLICLILAAGILLLWKNKNNFKEKTYKLLITALVFTILQELSFTLYIDNYGFLNMVGHYFKVFSFYFIYRAIVKSGIEDPYNFIFRELTANQAKLKEAKNAAEAANEMKSRFLANMSHEIRTPLNSVLGFADILYLEEKNPRKLESLEIIRNSGRHLLNLVNNILEFSKIEAGKVHIERESYSLRKLLMDLKKMFMLQAQEQGLTWEIYIDPSVPEMLVGDPHRVMQVLVNLTGNAFKFTAAGGVSIHVSCRNQLLEMVVKDTGIGIPEDKRETIFSAFEQADSSHVRKYGGTGLGLSITKNLLELMGGSIRYECNKVGSEFIVTLPAETEDLDLQSREAQGAALMEGWLKRAEEELGTPEVLLDSLADIAQRIENLEAALGQGDLERIRQLTHSLKGGTGTLRMTEIFEKAAAMDAELKKSTVDMEKVKNNFAALKEIFGLIPKIYLELKQLQPDIEDQDLDSFQVLVVDDNPENRKLIRYVLDRLKLKYQEAENGETALQMLHRDVFRIILLDAQMPVMDGMTVLKIIRKDPFLKHIYVIMQTASSFQEDIREFFLAGCDDYVSKPLELDVLEKKIWQFISGAAASNICEVT